MPLRCNCPRIQKTLIKFSRSFMRCTLTPKNWEINSKRCQRIGQYLSFVLQMHLSQCLLDVFCHLNMLLGCTNMVQWSELINELSTFVDSPCIRMAYAAGWCTGWRWALACSHRLCSSTTDSIQHSTTSSRDCGFILLGSEQRNKLDSVGVEGYMAVVHVVPFACPVQWCDIQCFNC